MANRVKVTSIEAIESFRALLILYLAKARATLEDVHAEVTRTRIWIQYNQRGYWEEAFKKRSRDLEEAQAVLFSSKMSTFRKVTAAEQMAVARAKRAKEEAESKLRVLRRWDRDFDNQVDPLMRHLDKLGSVLGEDMAKAVHFLTQSLTALDDYARIAAPGIADAGSGPPSDKKNEGAEAGEENAAPPTEISKGRS